MTIPETSPRKEEPGHWQELFFCFLIATAAAWLTTLLWVPLGRAFAEDYIDLAKVMFSTGSFESLHRPPGYVAFLTLAIFGDQSILAGEYWTVFLFQGAIHGLTTAIIREEMGWSGSVWPPRLVALAFGLNPVALIGAGYLHYDTLHVFLLVLTGATARRAFAAGSRPRDAFLAGAVASILTLVRPMTLPWPFILLALMFLIRSERRHVLSLRAVLLLAGFACGLAPHTWHNFQKTGRIIPVNAQTGAALWSMTEVELEPDSVDFPWVRLWYEVGMPIAAERLPGLTKEEDPFLSHTLAMNDLFLDRSGENLAKHPVRYVRNVGRNGWFYVSGNQVNVVRHFRIAQGGGRFAFDPVRKLLFAANEVLIKLIGLVGLIAALVRGRSRCLPVVSLLLCLWAVHSAVYLDYRYLYAQVPLWILVTGMALFSGEEIDRQTWLGRIALAIPAIMFASTLVGFFAVFF